MRESYREELDDIRACLVEMANSVGSQMSTATTALLDADVALADLVIAGDEQIDATRESIDQRCFTLLARQQPVATDLRTIVTATADRQRPRADGRPRRAHRQGRPDALPRARGAAGGPAGVPRGRARGRDARGQGRHGHRHARRRGGAASWRPTTTRWTGCTAACSASCSPTTGPTASRRPSTSPCSAATTSGSPTTRSASRRRVVYLVTGERPGAPTSRA